MNAKASSSLIVGRIQAEHELADRFNKELQQALDRRNALLAQIRSEGYDKLSALTKEYRYDVKDVAQECYVPAEVKATGPIRICRVWTNKTAFMQLAVRYALTGTGADDPTAICSVIYYRLHGLLVHLPGAGSALLKSNLECSDTDWQLIKSGIIPVRFHNLK